MAGPNSETLNSLRVIQWNARSLSGYGTTHKKAEFYKFLEKFETLPEVVCIQETWNSKKQNLKGYKPPVSYRREEKKRGGGSNFCKIWS